MRVSRETSDVVFRLLVEAGNTVSIGDVRDALEAALEPLPEVADLPELIARFEAELAEVKRAQRKQVQRVREDLPRELAFIRSQFHFCAQSEVADMIERLERRLEEEP